MRSFILSIALLVISTAASASPLDDIKMPLSPPDEQALEADHDFILQHHNAKNSCSEQVRCAQKTNNNFVRLSFSQCTDPASGRNYNMLLESVQYGPGNKHMTSEWGNIEGSRNGTDAAFKFPGLSSEKNEVVITNGVATKINVTMKDDDDRTLYYSYTEADLDCKTL